MTCATPVNIQTHTDRHFDQLIQIAQPAEVKEEETDDGKCIQCKPITKSVKTPVWPMKQSHWWVEEVQSP